LVELIITVVILGVLAVFAVPKFADLRREAVIAKIEGVGAGFQTAATLVRSKAMVHGVVDGSIDYNGTIVEISAGNFRPGNSGLFEMILDLSWNLAHAPNDGSTPCPHEMCYRRGTRPPWVSVPHFGGIAAFVYPRGYSRDRDACLAYMWNPLDGKPVLAGAVTHGC